MPFSLPEKSIKIGVPTYARLVAKRMDEQGFKETDAKTAKLAVYGGYGVTESSARDTEADDTEEAWPPKLRRWENSTSANL